MKKTQNASIPDGDFTLLAADLSQRHPGFALLRYHAERRGASLLSTSHVDNKKQSYSHGEMLHRIQQHMQPLMEQSDALVREKGFTRFSQETQALFKVVGVSDLTAHTAALLPFHEIAPTSVKKLVAGSGRATKEEVMEALSHYVGQYTYSCDDESDAAAVAVAWLIQNSLIMEETR